MPSFVFFFSLHLFPAAAMADAGDRDAAIAAFCEVTGCADPTTAEHVLDAHGWALDAAVAFQLESSGGGGGGGGGGGEGALPPPRDDSPVVVSEGGSPPYVMVEEAEVRARERGVAVGRETPLAPARRQRASEQEGRPTFFSTSSHHPLPLFQAAARTAAAELARDALDAVAAIDYDSYFDSVGPVGGRGGARVVRAGRVCVCYVLCA